MKLIIFLIFCSLWLSVAADETLDGNQLFMKHCSECHQKDGNSSDENIPKIAQFSAILIYDILDQFKSGDRKAQKIKTKEGQTTDMNMISKQLNSAEIEAIAHYLSGQSSKPPAQDYNQQLAAKGRALHLELCENCHVEKGTSPIEDTPILRGQWKTYLIRQLEAFSKQERDMPKRMKKRIRKLADEDKTALIEFYISPASH